MVCCLLKRTVFFAPNYQEDNRVCGTGHLLQNIFSVIQFQDVCLTFVLYLIEYNYELV
jgi:hypothetical protein